MFPIPFLARLCHYVVPNKAAATGLDEDTIVNFSLASRNHMIVCYSYVNGNIHRFPQHPFLQMQVAKFKMCVWENFAKPEISFEHYLKHICFSTNIHTHKEKEVLLEECRSSKFDSEWASVYYYRCVMTLFDPSNAAFLWQIEHKNERVYHTQKQAMCERIPNMMLYKTALYSIKSRDDNVSIALSEFMRCGVDLIFEGDEIWMPEEDQLPFYFYEHFLLAGYMMNKSPKKTLELFMQMFMEVENGVVRTKPLIDARIIPVDDIWIGVLQGLRNTNYMRWSDQMTPIVRHGWDERAFENNLKNIPTRQVVALLYLENKDAFKMFQEYGRIRYDSSYYLESLLEHPFHIVRFDDDILQKINKKKRKLYYLRNV